MTMTNEDVQKWEGAYTKACARADRWLGRYVEERHRRLAVLRTYDEARELLGLHHRVAEAVIDIRTDFDNGVSIKTQPLFDALEELEVVSRDYGRAADALPPDGQEATGTDRSSG